MLDGLKEEGGWKCRTPFVGAGRTPGWGMFALHLWLLVLIYADRDLVQLKNLAHYGPVIAL